MKSIFFAASLMFAIPSYAETYNVELANVTDELAQSSVTGVLVGIRLDDGSILNPTFTQEELLNGITTKTVVIESGRSVANCEYNWQLDRGRKALVPEDFSNAEFVAGCELAEGVFSLNPIFNVSKFTLEIKPEAMEAMGAYFLLANLTAVDDAAARLTGGDLALQHRDLPKQIDFRVFSTGTPTFTLLTKWLVRGSDPVEERIEIGDETSFVLQ